MIQKLRRLDVHSSEGLSGCPFQLAVPVLAQDATFANWQKKYDRSKKTVTRTGEAQWQHS